MFNTDRAAVVFGDAWSLYNDAIEILDLGKPRIAAEAAWGATKRATDALILARTGQEPSGTGQTSTGLRLLSRQEPPLEALRTDFNDIVPRCTSNAFTAETANLHRRLLRPFEARRTTSATQQAWRSPRLGALLMNTERVAALFSEAHTSYAESLKCMDEAIDLWDRELLRRAAKKTWAAALCATNALILACTGVEPNPDDDDDTHDRLLRLSEKHEDLKLLRGRYATLSMDIYQTVLCERNVEPVSLLIHDIRKTASYIRDAETLAGQLA